MDSSRLVIIASGIFNLVLAIGMSDVASAQAAKKSEYQTMAPVAQYQISSQAEEIAMARSAAPESIVGDAKVLVLSEHGYEMAVPGKGGFTCLVLRSWAASYGDAEFWNPKIRSPICYNAVAAHTVLPVDLEKTQWVLAGLTEAQMRARSKTSDAAHQVPAPGSMSFMMSKQQHLSDSDGHWHPHIMVYQPHSDASAWGANAAGSPVLGFDGPTMEASTFVVPVLKWSDGSAVEMH